MNIVCYQADQTGCGEYRIAQPARAMYDAGLAQVKISTSYQERIPWGDVDLVIMQRQTSEMALDALRNFKRMGIPVIYEVDDYVFNLHPKNPSFNYYADPNRRHNIEQILREVDAITVSCEYLKKRFLVYNERVYVIPNYIDSRFWRVRQKRTENEEINIGWSGGASHYDDLKLIEGVMEIITAEFPQVKFILVGWDPGFFRVPPNRREFYGFTTDFVEYAANLSHIDIGLAPLEDNLFNKCKSDIKLLEYGVLNIPVIASYVGPYKEAIDGGFVLKTMNPKDWIKQIRKLVSDEANRRKWSKKSKELALSRLLPNHIGERVRIYEEVIASKKNVAETFGTSKT